MAKSILLIHGAWHGSWCWKYVVPLLEKLDYTVIAIDLPGRNNNDMTPFKKINLATHVAYLRTVIQSLHTPVTLVGHSFAGIVMSQLAEAVPEVIDRLCYVSAFVPNMGCSLVDEIKQSTEDSIMKAVEIHLRNNEILLKKTAPIQTLFYNDCGSADGIFALAHLQREAYRPFIEPLNVSTERFGKLKKMYIACANDHVISLADQTRMSRQHACQMITLGADHSPFFSAPEALVAAITNNEKN